MLKRQRQPSPPPSSPSIPFVADSPADLVERNVKRRRTVPPVLDGTARGWATQQHPAPNDGDDEYTYSDNEIETDAHNHDPHRLQSQSEYKSTNTMLRELHTMHQHRLLFASPSEGQHPNTYRSPSSGHTSSSNPYPTVDKTTLPPQPNERIRSAHAPQSNGKTIQSDDILMEEATRVAELYEGPNKYLGSLFLSRRRKIGSSDEIPGR